MSSFAAAALVIGLLVAVGVPILWWIARSGVPRPEQRAAESARYEHRLRHPDFAALARFYGSPVSPVLQSLYADPEQVLATDVLVGVPLAAEREPECYVAFFEPADLETAQSPWPGCEGLFPFANNGAGDRYLVDPRLPDPPVVYYLHETGEKSGLRVRLSEFLGAPRRPVPDE